MARVTVSRQFLLYVLDALQNLNIELLQFRIVFLFDLGAEVKHRCGFDLIFWTCTFLVGTRFVMSRFSGICLESSFVFIITLRD